MIVGCYVTYREAKHHELHKMRAAFEDRHKEIEAMMKKDKADDDIKVEGFLEGELAEVSKALKLLDEEEHEDNDKYTEIVDGLKADFAAMKEKIDEFFKK